MDSTRTPFPGTAKAMPRGHRGCLAFRMRLDGHRGPCSVAGAGIYLRWYEPRNMNGISSTGVPGLGALEGPFSQ